MSEISNVENEAIYEGYDSAAAAEWCTPTFLGSSICISASATNGQVVITLSLKTPFGNVTKSFGFNANVSYTWQPFSRFKITVGISNFNEAGGVFSFDLNLKPCVDIFGWKCYDYSHHFDVPVVIAGIHTSLNENHFANLLTLHASGAINDDCKCNDHADSNLFKGDIYSNYLQNQAQGGFPTIPIISCIPTATCIPTIISCDVAAQPQAAYNVNPAAGFQTFPSNTIIKCDIVAQPQAGFPTIPIVSCIPTAKCIPTIISCDVASQANTALQAQAGFPTIPVIKCFPTGVFPLCAAQQPANSDANAALQAQGGFPTIPVISCIPTATCIPTITSCDVAAQANTALQAQAGFPTIPVIKCFPTGVFPICAAQQPAGANVNAALQAQGGFPTIPVISCIPTATCIPTIISCDVASQANTALQAQAGFPTIPVIKCFPTGIFPLCAAQQ